MDPPTVSYDFLMEKVNRTAFSPFLSFFSFIPFGHHLHFCLEVVLAPEEVFVCLGAK